MLASEQPVEVTVQEGPASAAVKRRKPRMRTEFPPFTTIRSGALYDLRLYDVRTIANTIPERQHGLS